MSEEKKPFMIKYHLFITSLSLIFLAGLSFGIVCLAFYYRGQGNILGWTLVPLHIIQIILYGFNVSLTYILNRRKEKLYWLSFIFIILDTIVLLASFFFEYIMLNSK